MRNLILIVAVLFVLVGCSTPNSSVPDSLPAVGGALERVETRVSGVEALVTQAGKGSAAIVRALLDASLVQLGFIQEDLDEAKGNLAKGETERGLLIKAFDLEHAARLKVEASKWYQFGVWVNRIVHILIWSLITAVVIHVGCLIASFFIGGFWGGLLSKIAYFVNPFAIPAGIVARIKLNRATAGSAAVSAMAGVASPSFPQAKTDY